MDVNRIIHYRASAPMTNEEVTVNRMGSYGRTRPSRHASDRSRTAQGVSFEATPGPGDSEGGDLYLP